MKYCIQCGKALEDEQQFCPSCGTQASGANAQSVAAAQNAVNKSGNGDNKSIPAFILGLIGAIFGLFGGICVTACYSFSGNDEAPMFLMIGGSLIGLLGSCFCFKNAKIGSILEIVAALMIGICAFTITGADITSLLGMALLGVGGAFGLFTSLTSNK